MTRSTSRSLHRARLLTGAALIAGTGVAPALAQSLPPGFQANGVVAGGSSVATIRQETGPLGGPQTYVDVLQSEAIINWTPINGPSGGSIQVLPSGHSLVFESGSNFTVLNRVLPAGNDTPIRFDGRVESRVDGTQGGSVWFYSPGGMILGASSVFDVGSLVLSASDIADGDFLNVARNGGTASFSLAQNPDAAITLERNPLNPTGGARINVGGIASSLTGNYLAIVAPRIEQGGIVRVDGSTAYVAAEKVNVSIDAGLFTINFDTGSAAANPIKHTGTTTSAASAAGPQNIIMASVPKNSAITLLLGGRIGDDTAAGVENGTIVLSAGYQKVVSLEDPSTAGPMGSLAGNITLESGEISSQLSAFASGNLLASPDTGTGSSTLTFQRAAMLQGRTRAEVRADQGEVITFASAGIGDQLTIRSSGGTAGLYADYDAAAPGIVTTITGGALRIDASAKSQTAVGTGGTAELIVNGASLTLGSVRIDAVGQGLPDPDFENATGGQGGTARVQLLGGATMVASDLVADASGLGGSISSSTGVAGSGRGGAASIVLSDSSMTLGATLDVRAIGLSGSGGKPAATGFGGDATVSVDGGTLQSSALQVTATGIAAGTFNASGNAEGGSATMLISGGADVDVVSSVGLDASADVQALDPSFSGGAAAAGAVRLTVDGANLTATRLDLSAKARGGDARFGVPGAATGGSIDLTSRFGGSISSSQGASLDAGAIAGSGGEIGAGATGGTILTTLEGGSLDLTLGDFSADVSAQITRAPGETPVLAQAGSIQIDMRTGRAGDPEPVLNAPGGLQLSANALEENFFELATGNSATAVGGVIGIDVSAGSLSAGAVQLSASGAGGFGRSGGPGGAGFAGRIALSLSGGQVSAAGMSLSADATGGQGAEAGYGAETAFSAFMSEVSAESTGLVTGGTANIGTSPLEGKAGVFIDLTGGTLSSSASINLSASADGGAAGDTFTEADTGGAAGGAAQGGLAFFRAGPDATVNVGSIFVEANATGGDGGDVEYFFTAGTLPAGAGGAATGGSAGVSIEGQVTSGLNAQAFANANGGRGGGAFLIGLSDLDPSLAAGGRGGDAIGGDARASMSGTIGTSFRLFSAAHGNGGAGGEGVTGGSGGAGEGGLAALEYARADAPASYTVFSSRAEASGSGGLGGDGRIAGGAGGEGKGGDAALTVAGNLTVAMTGGIAIANGFGGGGGSGGDGAAPAPGGQGGAATGGNATISVDRASLTLFAGEGGLTGVVASASGGSGGNGRDETFSTGGAGGNGTGGFGSFEARAGTITTAMSSTLQPNVTGFGGFGGFSTDGETTTRGPSGIGQGGTLSFAGGGLISVGELRAQGGTVVVGKDTRVVADRGLFITASNDIRIGAGALLRAAANAPDEFGYGATDPLQQLSRLELIAGPGPSDRPADDISSIIFEGDIEATNRTVLITADAVQGGAGSSVRGSNVFVRARNAPSFEVTPSRDEDEVLRPDCAQGNICLGRVFATGLVRIGEPDFTPNRLSLIGGIDAQDVLLRSNDTLALGGTGAIDFIKASNALLIESTKGNVLIAGTLAIESATTIRLAAAGDLIGAGATLRTPGSIDLTAGRNVTLAGLDAGQLRTLDGSGTVLNAAGLEVAGAITFTDTVKLENGLTLRAGTGIDVAAVDIESGAIDFASAGTVRLGAAGAGALGIPDEVILSGERVVLGEVTTGNGVSATASTSIDFLKLDVESTLSLTSGGTITGGDARASSMTLAASGGTLTAGQLETLSGALTLVAAGGLSVDGASSATNLNANATGIAAGTVDAKGAINLLAGKGAATIGSATAGGDLTIGAVGGIDFASLSAAEDLTVSSGGGVSGGTASGASVAIGGSGLTKVGDVTATAGALGLSGALVQAGDLTASTSVEVKATSGGATLGSATAAGPLSVTAGSTVAFAALASDKSVTILAGSSLTGGNISGATLNLTAGAVEAGKLTATAGDLVATTTGAFAVSAASATGTLDLAGGDVTASALTAGGPLKVLASGAASLGAATSGDAIDVTAAGPLSFTDVTAAAGLTLESEASLAGGNATGTTVALTAGGALSAGDVTATAGDLTVAALGDANLAKANATGTLTLVTTGAATLGTAGATQSVGIAAGGPIGFASLTAGDAVTVESADGVSGGDATGKSVTLIAVGALSAGILDASDGDLTVSAGDAVEIAGARATGALNLAGSAVKAPVIDAGGALTITAAGAVTLGEAASNDIVNISAAGSVSFATLTAIDAVSVVGDGITGGQATGTSVILTSGGLLAAGKLSATAGDLEAVADGNVTLGSAEATGAVTLGGADVKATSLTADGQILVFATGTATLGGVTSADAIAVEAGGAIGFADLAAAQTVTVNAAGDVVGGDAAGSDLSFTAGGALTAGSLEAAGDLQASAAGALTIDKAVGAGTLALSGATVKTATATAGSALTVASSQAAILGTARSDETLRVTAGGPVSFASLSATGALDVTSKSDVIGQDATGKALALDAGGQAKVGTLTATGGDLSAAAGKMLDLGSATATGALRVSGAELSTSTLTASTKLVAASLGDATFATAISADSIDLSATGTLTVINAKAANGGASLTGNNVVIGKVEASGGLKATAAGLITVNGLATGSTVELTSGDIRVAATAQIGRASETGAVTFTSTSGRAAVGGQETAGLYRLTDAELDRVASKGDITVAVAPTSARQELSFDLQDPGGATFLVDTLSFGGAQLGASGTLRFVSPGSIGAIGGARFDGMGAGQSVLLQAANDIALAGETGSLALRDVAGNLGGTLRLDARQIHALSTSGRAALRTAPDLAAASLRLAQQDGLASQDGFFAAGGLVARVSRAFFVQNSGTEFDVPDARRGISVGSGGLRIESTGTSPAAVAISGRVLSGSGFVTGGAAVPVTTVSGTLEGAATLNGCLFSNPASCAPIRAVATPPVEDPIPLAPALGISRDFIVEEASTTEEEEERKGEGGASKLPQPIIEILRVPQSNYDPLIDEPVTGSGNDDLWDGSPIPAPTGAPGF